MWVKISVQLKSGILDPQGKAVAGALAELGFDVDAVRVGKEIIVDIPAENGEAALEQGRRMAAKLLANPVTEDYHCQLMEA
ncbi:MAG: phosphoribosylformylglycinamidine synthase subunit PurS [Firmicutes bacterium]|nr:phosphoribosylformylglycinamidine synthase subunit PurS [Bacillota bacterium]